MFNRQNLTTFLALFFFLTTLSAINPSFQLYLKQASPYFSPSSTSPQTCSSTSSRFPPIPPSQQTREQAISYRRMTTLSDELFENNSFTLKNDEGAFLGPLGLLLYTPTLASSWSQLTHDILQLPHLTPLERELAILSALSHNLASYGLYAHSRIAKDAGLTQSQVIDARQGGLPKCLSDRESAIYEFVSQLVKVRGPLGEREFEKARKVLGRETVASLLHIAGSYMYSGILMNGADMCPPEGELI